MNLIETLHLKIVIMLVKRVNFKLKNIQNLRRPNDKPWFSSELRREIRRRDRLHKIMRRMNKEDSM